MARYQAVCDSCMHTETVWMPDLAQRDCPVCGVGWLLGPFAVAGTRFSTEIDWEVLTIRT